MQTFFYLCCVGLHFQSHFSYLFVKIFRYRLIKILGAVYFPSIFFCSHLLEVFVLVYCFWFFQWA